ncbi:MAG: protein BatD [Bdellovibrionaceae bacterium]|nr:protein BatD [Pseudobdellovibrionaceae bacterium]
MTKIGNFLSVLAITTTLVSVASSVATAKVSAQATVDRNEMAIGDSFTLTVSVASDGSFDSQEPRAPDLQGFELLNSWQSSSTSQRLVQGANGMEFEVQRRKEYNYLLSPRKAGTYSVGAFEVNVDGKVYNTQPITISVGEAGTARPQGRSRARPRPAQPQMPGGWPGMDSFEEIDKAEEELFNQLLQRQGGGGGGHPQGGGGNQGQGNMGGMAGGTGRPYVEPQFRSLPKDPNAAFFIQVEVDKLDVYEGEQVTVSWYIYTRGQMETLDRLKFPDLRGFWKEIIEEVPSIQFTDEVVNGVAYHKALLASHALFPIRAGTSFVDEYKIKSRVRLPNQNFGGFGFGKSYEYTKSSDRVKINVKPLPSEGRPNNFSGAVGQFDVQSSTENQAVPVNQPFSLKVRFEGTGNAKLIELPAIDWPKTLEVYDTKSDSKFFKNGRSYKEFEILLIPREQGDLKIPAIGVSMFDPATKKYYSRATQEINLKVEANANAPSGNNVKMADPGKITAPAKSVSRGDVLPELLLSYDKPSAMQVATEPGFWVGVYAFVFLFLGWRSKVELCWGRRRQNLREIIAKRYKKLDPLAKKNDYRAVGAEMTNIFNLVLGTISGQEASGLELERMLERIPPSLRREYGEVLRKQYEVFQVMSFAPENMLGVYKEEATVRKEVESAKSLLQKLINSNPEQDETQKS